MNINIPRINWEKRRRRKLGPLLQREGEKKKKKINEHEYSTN